MWRRPGSGQSPPKEPPPPDELRSLGNDSWCQPAAGNDERARGSLCRGAYKSGCPELTVAHTEQGRN